MISPRITEYLCGHNRSLMPQLTTYKIDHSSWLLLEMMLLPIFAHWHESNLLLYLLQILWYFGLSYYYRGATVSTCLACPLHVEIHARISYCPLNDIVCCSGSLKTCDSRWWEFLRRHVAYFLQSARFITAEMVSRRMLNIGERYSIGLGVL